MKVSNSAPVASSIGIASSKANKALEAKARTAAVKEFKEKHPGVKNIKVKIPEFEGKPGSSPLSVADHYGFMNLHLTGTMPGGKAVEANPSYSGQTGTMIWR
jgi:hypothetical protein